MDNKNIEIDLVYLWVDGSDPEWLKKKQFFTNSATDNSETNTVGRYVSNEELKYSLRSAEKYVPWVRRIFIVTDSQTPGWLNTAHPKIKMVDHKDIMPLEILPTFSSPVIEYHLHKIPELSEQFLYANDDMFFNTDLSPDFFFAKDGYPIVRLKRKVLGRWHHKLKDLVVKKLGQYRKAVIESMDLVEEKYGKYYSGVPHHNIDGYLKSDYLAAVEAFSEQIEKSKVNRVRTYGDLNRSTFSYYALAIGHGHLKYAKRNEASRMLVYKHDFDSYIKRYQPKLFCLNDTQHANDSDRLKIKPFLENHFPAKSSFEK